MNTKLCPKCEIKKDISEFHQNKNRNDALACWCKKCNSKYYYENKEKILKKQKEYQRKNKQLRREQNRTRIKNNPIKWWCSQTIQSHKKEYEILFKMKDLLPIAEKTKYCPLCDCRLGWEYGIGRNDNTPSLDRINNEKILTLNNIQIICYKCNTTKRNRTMNEFINYCGKIWNKFKRDM